ncbi:T9SS type A sorting domain-containing protein [Flavobacterium sp. CYK-4]|uniref:T9SS type A sorting domain-containing protein n=1 Tax=Flavobacterium lotistagni TaxID=2709660 RepID=UPI00140BA2F5|nr:T9SS type A sorting domain-containing protein [Flavobacterium lotistagni]NHM07570.1 T9SS type A sorting domain-containing protein [Flavobacterium lotistagni]
MKSILSKLLLLFAVSTFSQTVIEAEYFWDIDPGNGNGIPLQAIDGQFNQAIEAVFLNNAALSTAGNHVLGIRVKGQNGLWGAVYRKSIRIASNNNSNALVKITQGEYFWDNDPGQGNGNILLAFDGNFNQALESVMANNASLPNLGNHTIGIRVKANDGIWSPVFRKVLRVVNQNNSNSNVKITQGEYFWDNDPGEGNGYALLAFDGNFNQALESLLTSNATLPAPGTHSIGLRVKADDGRWGATFRKVFKVVDNNNSNSNVKIIQGEYFWDNDPGQGNGFALLAFDGNFNQALENVLANAANLPDIGNHAIGIRVKADDGIWGPVFRKTFRLAANNNTNNSVKIVQAEYFWNTDPGAGNGTPMLAFDGNFNQAIEAILAANAPFPSAGINLLNIRVIGDDGNWGNVYSKIVGIDIAYNTMVLLTSPVNGANQIPLTTNLVWQGITGAGSYEYQLATDASFSSLVQSGLVDGTSVATNALSSQTTYYWRVRANVAGNVSLWSAVWSFTTTTSLTNPEFEIGFDASIFPNPVQRTLNVATKLNLSRIEIIDFLGKKVNVPQTTINQFDVSRLASGVYFIRIESNQGQVFTSKFIKE